MIACLISASLFVAFLFWPQASPNASTRAATRVKRTIVANILALFRVDVRTLQGSRHYSSDGLRSWTRWPCRCAVGQGPGLSTPGSHRLAFRRVLHFRDVRYWWFNQNQTYRHEVAGGYLWSPKHKSNGVRNPYY